MADLDARNKKIFWTMMTIVVVMIGLSFAAVPFYKKFCQLTGIDGTVTRVAKAPDTIDKREITVLFDARVDSGLPWEFKPEIRKMTVHVGQQGIASYEADNLSANKTIGAALYNVTPESVAKYFHKIQCFCFTEQLLNGGETAHFPVIFFIDPAILKDPDVEDITDITLSYTFYAANSKAIDRAITHYGQKRE